MKLKRNRHTKLFHSSHFYSSDLPVTVCFYCYCVLLLGIAYTHCFQGKHMLYIVRKFQLIILLKPVLHYLTPFFLVVFIIPAFKNRTIKLPL